MKFKRTLRTYWGLNYILFETNKEDVENLCNLHHDFEHLFRLVLSKVIVLYRHRMFSLQFRTVKQRYQSLIKQHPKIELIVPLGDIATFLGITQETLSRIRATKA
ncbi:Crp/Fnr family transcriptional regulator [Aquimarina sp. I32.4]|uniref:Crp/Fnr family transcriptional regulator n=1 Tax=Aquimarina sp. I32.4 TaxID=2053903 RepID=UPI000CDF0582|nr:Crp/Fnr family transcriptional regulator [Aquimarina sp. I32.4]